MSCLVSAMDADLDAKQKSVTGRFVMAETDEVPFSLLSLEDELTCSICLSPFDCPVTIPCGHNFCQDCLLTTWKDSYSCPQCRTNFDTKPELKKNTVLSTVVETFNMGTTKSEASLVPEESEAEKQDVIRCDTCMEAEASKTCLTCMASYCEEHLRSHRENPKLSFHQLSEPVGDLSERICLDHHKLMDLFCSKHESPICSFCLQQDHKGCPFVSPEEQRSLKELDLRDKLGLLNRKTEKTETVLFQMDDMQGRLKDAATNRKTTLAAVYQQMRDLLVQEEREAQREVDHELETGLTKLHDIMETLTENAEKMTKAKEDVSNLLSQSENFAFLQASYDLPRAVKFEPHMPRITLDSKKVIATQTCAAALKDCLTEILNQPVEARLPILKPELNTDIVASDEAAPVSAPATTENTQSEPQSAPEPPQPSTHHASCQPIQPYFQPVPVPVYIDVHSWNPPQHPPSSYRGPQFIAGKKTHPQKSPEKKTSLGKVVVFKTAHKVTSKKAGETRSHAVKKDPQKSQEKKTSPVKKLVFKPADEQTPNKAGEAKSHAVKKEKKSDTSHQTPHKQDKRPPSASGGSKPSAKGSAKKDNPRAHSSPQKSSKQHTQPKKK